MKFGSLLSALNFYHTGFKQAITVRLSDYYLISKVWRKKGPCYAPGASSTAALATNTITLLYDLEVMEASQTHRPTNVHMADDITFTFLKQL